MKYLKLITALISLCFLIFTFYTNLSDLKEIKISSANTTAVYIISSSFFYAALLFLLSISWKSILESLSKTAILYKFAWIHSKTMIYKYIPGNVFHYVARHVEAKKEGISHKYLIQSNFFEVIIQVIASLTVSLLALTLVSALIDNIAADSYLHHINLYWAYGMLFFSMLLIFVIGKYTHINILDYIHPLLLHMAFFLGIGFLTYLIINGVLQIDVSFSTCVVLYSIAWLVGFITPGAPGGLGVRESLFIVLSNGILSATDALVASALLRVVTMSGELLIFIIASLVINKTSANQ